MKLKLCNNGLSVFGQSEDGMFVSYSVEADEYKQWLSEGNTPEPEFTEEELASIELNKKVSEAKQYLEATDFKMTVDYFATMVIEKQEEVIAKRAEAREFIRANQGVTDGL